jgi:hypothetical protein
MEPKFEIKGNNDYVLRVYEDRVFISEKKQYKKMTQEDIDQNSLYFNEITSIEFLNCTGWKPGVIEFHYPINLKRLRDQYSGFTLENVFKFNGASLPLAKEMANKMHYVHNFVQNKVLDCQVEEEHKETVVTNGSAADEILKFKALLDQQIITQEEFEAKKKQLLGL